MIKKASRYSAKEACLPKLSILGLGLAIAALPASGYAGGSGTLGPSSTETLRWTGAATGTGALDQAAWVDGVNVDTYKLKVTGTTTDWNNKAIKVLVQWTNAVNDYDVYLFKNGVEVTHDGSGAPATSEAVVINPSTMGVGDFEVKIAYYANTPQIDQPRGNAWVSGASPVYLKGGLGFGTAQTLKAPVSGRDGEPSSRCDSFGNYYIGGIRGVPAGVDMWHVDLNPNSPTYDPYMRNATYLGQPDSFTQDEAFAVGADGGGDIDIAVGFGPTGPNNIPTLAFTSLVAANISTGRSIDGGQTFTLNPVGNVTGGIPVDDRQWIEFYGKDVVYLFYRTFNPAVSMVQRSNDGGLTWGPARTAGLIGQAGSIDVDQNDGTVYIAGSSGKVAVGVPPSPGAEPLTYNVYSVGGGANIFFVVRVADDGTAYVCYSDGKNVYIKWSKDKGVTWSSPIRVNDGPESRTSLLPWLETGPTPGSVGVVWYGTSETTNSPKANWRVYYAQGEGANTSTPVFRQVVASDHYIHHGVISLGGTLGDQNRNLLDYFQICFDPLGAAVIGYTADHNDFDGHTFVTRQISGPTVKNTKLEKPVEGAELPPPMPFSADGSQVVDFERDVETAALTVLPNKDQVDITSIKYSNEKKPDGEIILVAQMKVSELGQTLVPNSTWRMNFTANAPAPYWRSNQNFGMGISDAGDQLYVSAVNTVDNVLVGRFGTAVRNADGTLTYTNRGNADSVAFDPVTRTITVKCSVNKLNPFVLKGPKLAVGSILCGLRGSASSPGKSDGTRGGTLFKIR